MNAANTNTPDEELQSSVIKKKEVVLPSRAAVHSGGNATQDGGETGGGVETKNVMRSGGDRGKVNVPKEKVETPRERSVVDEKVSTPSGGEGVQGDIDNPITSLLPSKEEFARAKKVDGESPQTKKVKMVSGEQRKGDGKQNKREGGGGIDAQGDGVMRGVGGGTQKADKKESKDKKSKEESKKSPIPVLRTFQGDSANIAYTTSGAEVRKILAVEMEKKKKEQEEYLQKTKEMLKESVSLKEKQRKFAKNKKKRGEQGKKQPNKEQSGKQKERKDAERMTNSVIGALNYAKKVKMDLKPAEKPSTPQERGDQGIISEKKKRRKRPQTVHHGAVEVETSRKKKDEAGQGEQNTPQEKESEKDVPTVSVSGSMGTLPQTKQKSGLLGRLRGSIGFNKKTITEEQREMLQKKQEEAVEKETIRSAWKEFETKKEGLREAGLRARDIRSYDTTAAVPNRALQRQNIFAIFAVFLILAALIAVIVYVATRPSDTPGTPIMDETPSVSDIVTSEGSVSIELLSSPDLWKRISEKNANNHSIVKFIPYEMVERKSVQFDLNSFFSVFDISIPDGLKRSLGDYYFVGNYTSDTTTNGIFIVTVKNYGDALSWMLGWENEAINAFAGVFPGTLIKSNPGNTEVQSKIINNKDVRVLTNARSDMKLLYYFFNRSILVFIVGEEEVVGEVNNRIRSANAQ